MEGWFNTDDLKGEVVVSWWAKRLERVSHDHDGIEMILSFVQCFGN